jgi:hypothetical protein
VGLVGVRRRAGEGHGTRPDTESRANISHFRNCENVGEEVSVLTPIPPRCARGIENGFRTRQYPLTTREGRVILSSLS